MRRERGGRSETSSGPGPGEPRWWVAVRRMAGGIQSLDAIAFGRWAFDALAHCHHPAIRFKDIDRPAYLSLGELSLGIVLALLAASGLVGGLGLLAGRAWVRRPEAAYLVVLAVLAIAGTATDIRLGSDWFLGLAFPMIAFALPALPFAFRDRPGIGGFRIRHEPIPA